MNQVDAVEILEYDENNTAISHDMLEKWIRDSMTLKSGLVIYHAINACFAIAVLVSASITALSFGKTMKNIRAYQKLVGNVKYLLLSIDRCVLKL